VDWTRAVEVFAGRLTSDALDLEHIMNIHPFWSDSGMIHEGARVKLRHGSDLTRSHPELANAVGVVGSVMGGAPWRARGATAVERWRDITAHVRFRELNIVALNVPGRDLETVDHLSPELDAG
jgi:hypothetical protein